MANAAYRRRHGRSRRRRQRQIGVGRQAAAAPTLQNAAGEHRRTIESQRPWPYRAKAAGPNDRRPMTGLHGSTLPTALLSAAVTGFSMPSCARVIWDDSTVEVEASNRGPAQATG
jgi:hypothetical protein